MTKTSVLNALMTNGKIDAGQAENVLAYYRKIKVLKFNAHDGYSITHGAFFDHDVIARALQA